MGRLRFLCWYFGQWLRFYFRAQTIYNLHSSFTTQLAQAILEDRRAFYIFSFVETLRKHLAHSKFELDYADLGAPSQAMSRPRRNLAQVARFTAIDPESGRRLFRLVQWLKPATMLELGSGLGLSTLYQAAGARNARFFSLEGNPILAKRASQHLRDFGFLKTEVRTGLFKDTLLQTLEEIQQLDYLFIDGDHRHEAVLENFGQCKPFLSANSVVVLADIHWSASMQKAWQSLLTDPDLTLSIDLFDVGILFFKKGAAQTQHLSLVSYWWKPWRIGLF